MNRSKWKGRFIKQSLLNLKKKNKKILIWSRYFTIPEFLVGTTCYVYTGKLFRRVLITKDKVGYKFGEFSFTRKFYKTTKIRKIQKRK